MGTILVIIEGMDNTGKTTLIEQYKRIVSGLNPDTKVQVIHMEKPSQDLINTTYEDNIPFSIKKKQIINYNKVNEFQHNAYMNLPTKLYEIKTKNDSPDIIILDRAWISEYVYGYLYRNRNKHDIIIDNVIIEKKIMNIFGEDNVFLVHLYPENIDFIENHEDGKSLAVLNAKEMYPDDENFQRQYIRRRLNEELYYFSEAFNELSILKHKQPIQVNKTGSKNEFINSVPVQMFEFIHM